MRDHDECPEYSNNNPGFEGEYEFDLTIEMLGRRITRRARAVYAHTPRWEYFDLQKNALFISDIPDTVLRFEILALPKKFHEDGRTTAKEPYWVTVDDLTEDNLFPMLMIALLDAIDDQCSCKDAERRKEHKGSGLLQAASVKRRQRRRAPRE
jgi:hypothetical protein